MKDNNKKQALNPALVYNFFTKIIRNAESNVTTGAKGLLGYESTIVGRRILQRIVELGLQPFLQACTARNRCGEPGMPADGATFKCGGLRFDAGSHRIMITPFLWLRSLFEFGLQWLRILTVVTRPALGKLPATPHKATLLLGAGINDILLLGNDRPFLDFCRNGPISPLQKASRLVVESPVEFVSTAPSYCTYSKYPLFYLAAEYPARGSNWLIFFLDHVKAALTFLAVSLRHPLIIVIARDIAFHALLAHLDRSKAIENLVVASTHYHAQPLWMRALPGRHFTTHMVWYSQNCIPFTYRFDEVRSYLPDHRYIEVDDLWVWTPGFLNYLVAQGVRGRIHAVGPILWYLPPPNVKQPKQKQNSIVVFDVTPFNRAFVDKMRLPYSYYYYRPENARAFIADIITARNSVASVSEREIPIVLKHKRAFSPHHEAEYLEFVENEKQKGAITTVESATNLYSLIAEAMIVVAIPYSSPAYVAAHLGVPAIYYDPAAEIVPLYEAHPCIEFVTGCESLRVALEKALSSQPYAANLKPS